MVSVIQNINEEKTNVILGDKEKVLYGRDYIEDQLLGKTYRISAKSFYQVNTQQAEYLYQTAIKFAELDKRHCDRRLFRNRYDWLVFSRQSG